MNSGLSMIYPMRCGHLPNVLFHFFTVVCLCPNCVHSTKTMTFMSLSVIINRFWHKRHFSYNQWVSSDTYTHFVFLFFSSFCLDIHVMLLAHSTLYQKKNLYELHWHFVIAKLCEASLSWFSLHLMRWIMMYMFPIFYFASCHFFFFSLFLYVFFLCMGFDCTLQPASSIITVQVYLCAVWACAFFYVGHFFMGAFNNKNGKQSSTSKCNFSIWFLFLFIYFYFCAAVFFSLTSQIQTDKKDWHIKFTKLLYVYKKQQQQQHIEL